MRWTEEQLKKYLEKNQKTSPVSKEKKPSKYKNKRVKIDGHYFDSIRESKYYEELKLRLMAGDILGFCLQPKFILSGSISYKPDFIVWNIDGTTEIIDVKASEHFKTDVYKLKKKLFKEKYPHLEIIEIYEV